MKEHPIKRENIANNIFILPYETKESIDNTFDFVQKNVSKEIADIFFGKLIMEEYENSPKSLNQIYPNLRILNIDERLDFLSKVKEFISFLDFIKESLYNSIGMLEKKTLPEEEILEIESHINRFISEIDTNKSFFIKKYNFIKNPKNNIADIYQKSIEDIIKEYKYFLNKTFAAVLEFLD